jgi:hypothetical protein
MATLTKKTKNSSSRAPEMAAWLAGSAVVANRIGVDIESCQMQTNEIIVSRRIDELSPEKYIAYLLSGGEAGARAFPGVEYDDSAKRSIEAVTQGMPADEAKQLISSARRLCSQILNQHKGLFRNVTGHLLNTGSLTQQDMNQLLRESFKLENLEFSDRVRLKRLSAHEASHAIMSFVFNVPVESLSCDPVAPYCRPDMSMIASLDPWQSIAVIMAGSMGEHQMYDYGYNWQDFDPSKTSGASNEEGDAVRIRQILDDLPAGKRKAVFDRAYKFCRSRVIRNQHNIRNLAGRLAERLIMNRNEINHWLSKFEHGISR